MKTMLEVRFISDQPNTVPIKLFELDDKETPSERIGKEGLRNVWCFRTYTCEDFPGLCGPDGPHSPWSYIAGEYQSIEELLAIQLISPLAAEYWKSHGKTGALIVSPTRAPEAHEFIFVAREPMKVS